MRIADVLRRKGSAVVTVEPSATVTELLGLLAEHNVGALVVLDGERVVGIVSERDVVRRLHERGARLLDQSVSKIMTAAVVTCTPADTVDRLTVMMTENRIRHVPVLVDGKLAGIVSIGDVVKSRISQLEDDQELLESYIAQAR
ncbi:CBS domain-containing protein [Gandjariella thermophila]|uniref:Histidine kinase n=1 Tax=Gandjariella thermophila TaxID=1931992 RepID=A0A4D4J5E9_9PSEU|nr:CBS domain-containing protein [Gandjariella thermophila]GDY30310.1 histidine kinase [Gandjariella thermophila]